MRMPHIPFSVDEVFRRPILILIRIPEIKGIIKYDGVRYICSLHGLLDIHSLFLKREFWSMYSENHESLISIFLIPSRQIWECTLTVDARVCPKVNNHDLSFKRFHSKRITIDPLCEFGRDGWSLIGNLHRKTRHKSIRRSVRTSSREYKRICSSRRIYVE